MSSILTYVNLIVDNSCTTKNFILNFYYIKLIRCPRYWESKEKKDVKRWREYWAKHSGDVNYNKLFVVFCLKTYQLRLRNPRNRCPIKGLEKQQAMREKRLGNANESSTFIFCVLTFLTAQRISLSRNHRVISEHLNQWRQNILLNMHGRSRTATLLWAPRFLSLIFFSCYGWK